jgi:hypothetical protein
MKQVIDYRFEEWKEYLGSKIEKVKGEKSERVKTKKG